MTTSHYGTTEQIIARATAKNKTFREYVRQDFTDSPSVEQVLARALPYRIEKRPLFLGQFQGSEQLTAGAEVSTHRAIVRTDTGKMLSIVGRDYPDVQHWETMGWVQALVDSGEVAIRAAGYTDDGAKVFIEAELLAVRPFEVVKGDVIQQRITFTNSYDGSSQATAWYNLLRLLCLNGMCAFERSKVFAVPHKSGFIRKLDQAQAEFMRHRELASGQAEVLRDFATRKLSKPNLVRYVREVLGPDGAGNDPNIPVRNVDRILAHNESAPGAQPGTLWGGFNALTYYATHDRGRNANSRQNALLFGDGGKLIARALTKAQQYALLLPRLAA